MGKPFFRSVTATCCPLLGMFWVFAVMDASDDCRGQERVTTRISEPELDRSRADLLRFLDHTGSRDSFQSHPATYQGLCMQLNSVGRFSAVVDIARFARLGRDMDEIVLPTVSTDRVKERSAIRLILSHAALGYYIDKMDRLVITEEAIAARHFIASNHSFFPENREGGGIEDRQEEVFMAGYAPSSTFTLNELIILLSDPDDTIAFDAAFAVGNYGVTADDAINALIECLCSSNKARHTAAVYALGRIGQPAMATLVEVAKNDDHFFAFGALRAIQDVGLDGNGAYQGLLENGRLLSVPNKEHKWSWERYNQLCETMAAIGTEGDLITVDPLFESASSRDRALAAAVCESFRVRARQYIPKLLSLLGDSNDFVRQRSILALNHIPLDRDVDFSNVRDAVHDSDPVVRLVAQAILQTYAHEHSPASRE